jgi:hypothetical protein
MRVRETLWFKIGELPANDQAPMPSELPLEERYADDGSVTQTDQAAFSLKTGTTNYLPVIAADAPSADDGSLDSLVGEMKRGRRRVFAVIGASVAIAAVLVVICTL